MGGRELAFGLSRSMGRERSFGHARDLAALLHRAGFAAVVPFDSYEALEGAVLAGDVDVAWAPPICCARVEDAGGEVILRSIRAGHPTYGSALLRDAHYPFDLTDMPRMAGLRAVWVDRHSTSGYILPRHALREAGVDLSQVFMEEHCLGSYDECLKAILAGAADVTACYYSGTPEAPRHRYVDVVGKRARFFHVLGLSRAAPHDGIAISPAVPAEERGALERIFSDLAAADRRALAQGCDADGFDRPSAGTYSELLSLIEE